MLISILKINNTSQPLIEKLFFIIIIISVIVVNMKSFD